MVFAARPSVGHQSGLVAFTIPREPLPWNASILLPFQCELCLIELLEEWSKIVPYLGGKKPGSPL